MPRAVSITAQAGQHVARLMAATDSTLEADAALSTSPSASSGTGSPAKCRQERRSAEESTSSRPDTTCLGVTSRQAVQYCTCRQSHKVWPCGTTGLA